jgi:hypothetical protein
MKNGTVPIYNIIYPAISSAGVYLFTTDTDVNYEVRFGRKQDNILHAIIVFGVTNDEYEGEEYIETNRGELYRVMTTMVTIVRAYMEEHPNVKSYEFTGISKEGEDDRKTNKRVKLYDRYLPRIFDDSWEITPRGNTYYINKKKI